MKIVLVYSLIFLAIGCTQSPTSVTQSSSVKKEKDAVQSKPYSSTFVTRSSPETQTIWAEFRNLKWGTNIKNMNDHNMVLIGKDKELTMYRRADDKLSIGNAVLSTLYYLCYQDRFCAVTIQTEESSNFTYLKDAVFARYGKGYQPNEFIDKWTWGGSGDKYGLLPFRGVADVVMSLDYNEFSEEANLVMSYAPIWKEYQNSNAKAAKEAGKDF
jgi:hypothetical protein